MLPNRIVIFVVLTLLLVPIPGWADSEAVAGLYDYLNEQRAMAGMTTLVPSGQLEAAAQGHADYLSLHHLSGHYQDPGLAGFTGVAPADRAGGAGYPSRFVVENVSTGQRDGRASVDDLMGAIYHRIGFLGFAIDEVGIGIAGPLNPSYSYSMGNAGLAAVCAAGAAVVSGSYYSSGCSDNQPVAVVDYDGALDAVRRSNPVRVVWPPDGAADIPPAFFEERPDPLPDYGVSGYPASLHFNEAEVAGVELLDLRLTGLGGSSVGPVRLMDRDSDPNNVFSSRDFALFPLQRLAWDTRYRVDSDYFVDDERRFVRWHFKTRHPGLELFTLRGDGDGVTVGSGSRFAVYLPPAHGDDAPSRVAWRYSSSVSLEVGFIDSNTLWVQISGRVGDQAEIEVEGRTFYVEVNADAPLETIAVGDNDPGCPGGVELARFFPAAGVLELPVVTIPEAGQYRAVMSWDGGMVFDLLEVAEVGDPAACAAAVFADGVLTIASVQVANGREMATGYRAALSLDSGVSNPRFVLTDALPE